MSNFFGGKLRGSGKTSTVWINRSKKSSSSNNNNSGPAHAAGAGDEEFNYMNQNKLVDNSLLGSDNPDILDPSKRIGSVSEHKSVEKSIHPINMGKYNTFVIWGHGCTIDKINKYVTSVANKATLCSKQAGETGVKQKQIYAEHLTRLKLIGTKSPIKTVDQTSKLQQRFSPSSQVFVYTPVRFGQDMYSQWWGASARITPLHIQREAYVPDELCEGKYKLFEYSASGIEGTYELPNIYVTGSQEENQICGIKHALSKKWIVNFKKVTNDRNGIPNANSYKNSHTFDKLVEFITSYVHSEEGIRNGTKPREPIRIITGFCLGGINPYIAYTHTRGLEGTLSAMTLDCANTSNGSGSAVTISTILAPKKSKKKSSIFLKKSFRLPKRKRSLKKIVKSQSHTQTQSEPPKKRFQFHLKKTNKFKAKPPKFLRKTIKKK
tara:strand:+ start:3064 stop:4371 length:1308 start_codon:yes stop_codon:yes gene_type:complete